MYIRGSGSILSTSSYTTWQCPVGALDLGSQQYADSSPTMPILHKLVETVPGNNVTVSDAASQVEATRLVHSLLSAHHVAHSKTLLTGNSHPLQAHCCTPTPLEACSGLS